MRYATVLLGLAIVLASIATVRADIVCTERGGMLRNRGENHLEWRRLPRPGTQAATDQWQVGQAGHSQNLGKRGQPMNRAIPRLSPSCWPRSP